MASKITELRGRATELARHPRTKKIAIWFVSVMAAIGVIGALVAPPLLRRVLANQLTTKLHRQVSIEQIRINPYAMSATVRGFTMKERQSPATAVSFDELYVNLELQSLFRWGLVVKALHLVKPYVNLVRNEDRTYNYKDLIDEFMSGPSGPTPRFSVNNIQIIDGKIDFDNVVNSTAEGIKHFQNLKEIVVDLTKLQQGDSSALALITMWIRSAKALKKEIWFMNMPIFLQNLARVSGLEKLIPIR